MGSGTTIWATVNEFELTAISHASWRSWPSQVPLRAVRSREDAVVASKDFAREHGSGCVVRLEVDARHGERTAIDVNALNRAITAAMMVDAEYLGAVGDLEIRAAETAMGLKFPIAWRKHVQSTAWFRRGWMRTGAYVWLYTPSETAECVCSWGEAAGGRVGMIVIGGDGGGEMLTLDTRAPVSAVTLTPSISIGWQDSVEQAPSVETFVSAIDDGTFAFLFGT